jgi:2'-5' RNA ligase
MRAAIALLVDHQIQNFARRTVFDLERRYGIGFFGSLLPAHVSLKQPFECDDMGKLEAYFDALAASIQPFEVAFDRFYHWAGGGYGILGLNVVETETLRGLHNRIVTELKGLFADTAAAHDGAGYHFHLTIELGQVAGEDVYKRYLDSLPDKNVALRCIARELALFYYAGEARPGSFITYKVSSLGG